MPDVAVLIGSLRQNSFSRRLADAIARVSGPQLAFRMPDLRLPLYDDDEIHDPPPESVAAMKACVSAADAILFVTPEHNRSIPAALKNAIDWGSRPRGQSCWAGKPAAIVGGSIGLRGGAIAQAHLRSMLVSLECRLLGQPELYIHYTPDNLAALESSGTDQMLADFAARFESWILDQSERRETRP